jgi:hypothetical protein
MRFEKAGGQRKRIHPSIELRSRPPFMVERCLLRLLYLRLASG